MSPSKTARQHPAMGAISVRLPAAFLAWLNDEAFENQTTMGQQVRNCVALAIDRSGKAKAYGITIVDGEV